MSKTALVSPDNCNGCQMDARQGIDRQHDHGCPHALRLGEYCNTCVGMLISRERQLYAESRRKLMAEIRRAVVVRKGRRK
jgi:hypothetical protein